MNYSKKARKRVISLLLTLSIAVTMLSGLALSASAAVPTDAAPYAQIEYDYSDTVSVGTIRYVNQNVNNTLFHSEYWGIYTDQAFEQCGTSSMSMALSYIGVDAEPGVLADLWGAAGGSFSAYFGSAPGVTSISTGDFFGAMERYLNGAGQYSPVLIHLYQYSARGHFVLVVGQVSEGVYLVLDPYKSDLWQMSVSANEDGTLTLTYNTSGGTISETVTNDATRGVGIYAYQYHNANAVLETSAASAMAVQQKEVFVLPFTDITEQWQVDAATQMYQSQLMLGTEETAFSPNEAVTRATLATVLYRLAGEPAVDDPISFTDVPADAAYANAITWAAENRLIVGMGEGLYEPESTVTRQQLALVLYRYYTRCCGFEAVNLADLSAYLDAGEVSVSAETAVKWAVGNELISGNGNGQLMPTDTTTRIQLAAVIANYSTQLAEQ